MRSIRVSLITVLASVTTATLTLASLTSPAAAASSSIWQVEKTVNPQAIILQPTNSTFAAVSASGPDEAWAIGTHSNGEAVDQPLAEHWSGTHPDHRRELLRPGPHLRWLDPVVGGQLLRELGNGTTGGQSDVPVTVSLAAGVTISQISAGSGGSAAVAEITNAVSDQLLIQIGAVILVLCRGTYDPCSNRAEDADAVPQSTADNCLSLQIRPLTHRTKAEVDPT